MRDPSHQMNGRKMALRYDVLDVVLGNGFRVQTEQY